MMKSPTWRYAVVGVVFGLLFPVASMVVLIATGAATVPSPTTVAGLLGALHAHSPLLYVIETAPLFLGMFAASAGVRQTQLIALNASLEQRVAEQTESLRNALQQAEKANVMISHMADHDPLTGLLNRRRMNKELAAAVSDALRHGDPFALVFVDLDRFKAINDNHGHDAGDRFLVGFAELLEGVVRETDKIGRWGGDEFVILLPRSTRSGTREFTDRLKALLSRESINIGTVRLPASASIGVAEHPEDGHDPAALLAHADNEMYRRKHHQRDDATRLEAAA